MILLQVFDKPLPSDTLLFCQSVGILFVIARITKIFPSESNKSMQRYNHMSFWNVLICNEFVKMSRIPNIVIVITNIFF